MLKQATLKKEKENLVFFFPSNFSDESIVDAIKSIRLGHGRDWHREFHNLEVEVKELEKLDSDDHSYVLDEEYKYIVLCERGILDNIDSRCMVVFPKSINHDYMLEVVQRAVLESNFEGGSPIRKFSAGFVSHNGYCAGRSETLNVESHKDDSALFKKTFAREKV